MKTLLLINLSISFVVCFGQTKIEKSVPLRPGQKVELNFDYPQIIKVETWDKNEVQVTGSVSINRGENDNAFELQVSSKDNVVSLASLIKDIENIPRRIVIKKGDKEYFFKAQNYNDPEIQKFLDENGHDYSYMSNGVIKDITLEVFVPKGTETTINAKHGLVEIKNFAAPLTVYAQHGAIDATISKNLLGQLTARTRHGEILTNLDVKFNSEFPDKHDRWTEIHAKLGTGPNYTLEAKHGKVYLRKP